MESKVDAPSGEICGNNAMCFSANDVSSCSKSRKGETWGNPETKNLISINSSYGSSSGNSEHKVCTRTSDVSDTSDVTAPMLEAPKSLEEHGDSMSCVIRGGEANKISNFNEEERVNLPCTVFLAEESMKHPKDHLNLVVRDVVAPGNAGDPPNDACIAEKMEGLDKIMHSSVLLGTHANSLETHANEGSNDSDVEEHDVKVCDICGDAGREDLLAICCRCTDGAEHTYCMREMLEKIPEGDWLCEECKFEKENENKQQYNAGRAGGNENGYSSGQITITKSDHHGKTDAETSDFVGDTALKECSYGKGSSTRNAYDSEAIYAAKKQALQLLSGSPKAESPNRVPMLSRESSFKNLGKGKVKPVHQFSVVNDSSASGPRMQSYRGTFSKSNSFSSLIAKPKAKLVDEVFPAKQKLMRETALVDSKEGAFRSMGKSVSFKPTTASRSNCTESKVKMFSPKFSHDQDIKWPRHKKEQSSFERKNSLRSDHLAGGTISSPKSDNKPALRSDPSSLSSLNNNRDSRDTNSDSKPVTISKSTSGVAREVWKKASYADGVSCANRISNSEKNPSQAIPKEESSSSSFVAERPPCNSNDVLPDGLSQTKESTSFGDKMRESSVSRSKQNSTASGKIASCQKCKGNGHLAQFCTVDGLESSALGSHVKNSREATNGPSDLKAAIEAAMLRKPGICRKSRVADQSEDISVLNIKSDIASQDQLPATVKRNVNCAEEAHKQETANNAKQFGVLAEAPARTRGACPVVSSDVKHSVIDIEHQTLVSMPALLKTPIPEYQYIWQGGFEVQKSGNSYIYDGIQAHLSSCASPKVLDAVNKFSRKLILIEVSRLSSWPVQFQECGLSEDNIALFFFAKDIGSYEKSYKVLLGNMVKHDLALQGNFGGIELLIFPSNQLPEKFQRWNMMFFLWGVFRGKKADSLQHFPGGEKPLIQDIPLAATSLPENISPLVPKLNSACGNAATNTEMPATKESESASSSHKIVNGNCSTQSSSQVSRDKCPRISAEQNGKLDSSSIQSRVPKLLTDQRYFGIPLVEAVCSSVQTAERVGCPNMGGSTSVHSAAPLDREKLSLLSDETPSSMQEVTCVGSTTKKLSSKDDLKLGHMCLDNVSTMEGVPLARHTSVEPDLNVASCCSVNHKKRSHSAETVLQSASSSRRSQAFPIYSLDDNMVDESCNKRWKPNFDNSNGFNDHTNCSKDGLLSEMQCTASRQKNEASSKTAILECPENAEMFFFPVDPRPIDNIGSNNSSMPWKVHPLDEDQVHDKAPNLELALGAKTKPVMLGIPSFLSGKVGKKIIEENSSANAATKEDVSASLSLSLSFPFPEEEEQGSSASKPEQEVPDRRRQVNTSLLLFGGPEG